MINYLKYICFLNLFFVSVFSVKAQNFSQERGMPFIRNYSPEEYHAHESNFDVIQGDDGLMYFANFAGVLQFDGTNWNRITTKSGMRVLSLAKDKNGRIYVGGFYDFGYLSKNEFGKTSFISLVPKKIEQTDIGLIFKVLIDDDKVIFAGENQLFIYENNKVQIRNLNNKLLSAFGINNNLYFFFDTKATSTQQTGLHIFKNGKFSKLNATQGLTLLDIHFMAPGASNNEMIIGSENQGLFLLKNNQLSEFNSPVNKYLKENGLNCGIKTGSQEYAVGTAVGGIVLFNESGEIIQVVDQNAKLQEKSINGLFTDKNKSLWAATDNGVSKIEINWPLTYIDNKASGLLGKVQDIELFRDRLYIATDEGLFYLYGSTIKKVEKLDVACLSLLKIADRLLAATSRGIYLIENDKVQLTSDNNFTFFLKKSLNKNTIFYAGQASEVSVYQVNNNRLDLLKSIKNISGDVLEIEENPHGDIFLEVSPGRIFLVKNGSDRAVEFAGSGDFLSLHLNKLGEDIFFSSEKGLYSVNQEKSSITPWYLNEKDSLSQKLWIHDLFELSENTFLVTDGEQKGLSFLSITENKAELNQTPFLPVESFAVNTVWINSKTNQIWAGGKDGLLIANYKNLYDYNSKFETSLRVVKTINSDSLLSITSSELHLINYSDNSILFDFSIPVYPATGSVEYRYYLEGFDKDTSAWTSLAKKEYTNLPDDEYEFVVEAKNEFGKVAESARFKFKILTPIYRQWWAIIIYALLFFALVRMFFIWRLRASKKEKERLEELVKERTEEIELSKKKIEEQRDIAYKHRKEILDSISYAQKIQQAVLPSEQVAEDILLEHFIFYRPRDIVSGDFYWMKKLNNFVAVVAADCTGHGVPGAFMSMLGSSFLNEIVTRRSLDSAAQILNRLRAKVKKSLHQEGKEGEQKDGMDIALLIIDNETLELQYSGAYNPLYIIRPKTGVNILDENIDIDSRYELIHLKADRQPIGIHLAEKEFTNHRFQLAKGDSLYSFSDGYVDQFGGETGEKFKTKRFKELLMSVQGKSMQEQKTALEQAFVKWKRDLAQIDDVLVMGIKV
jgi:serine phosphatase RsbU (regulator of sigma subunit)/ligand-binding sensor domain-containing protein